MIGCFAGTSGFDCSLVWIIMTILFFIAAIARRQLSDLLDINFSLIGATILGEIAFVATLYIFSGMKIPFVLGIAGIVAGGLIGSVWDQSDDGGGFG